MFGINSPENQYDYAAWQKIFSNYDPSTISSISQQNQKDIAELYEKFLEIFPHLHIYWTKYAQFQLAASGVIDDAIKIFERALEKNILFYSIDMWNEFIKFIVSNMQENKKMIRAVYARALDAVGWHFKSGSLWTQAIDFELQNSRNPFFYYAKSVKNPTSDLVKLYKEMQTIIPKTETEIITGNSLDMTLSEYINLPEARLGTQIVATDDKNRLEILSQVATTYERSAALCREILPYESQITRDYFHFITPDEAQISIWEQYSTWAIEKGNNEAAVRIFERAVIPCAHIDAIWLEYAFYLEDIGKIEEAREVYERMPQDILKRCKVYHAAFEEQYNKEKASEIYQNLSSSDFVEEVLAAANYFHRIQDDENSVKVLTEAQARLQAANDSNGAGVVNARLMDIQWPTQPVENSAVSIVKFCQLAENDDKNTLLFNAVFGEPAPICLEDRVQLAVLYYELIRTLNVSLDFQTQLEMKVQQLKSKLLWYRSFFDQNQLINEVPPERIQQNWEKYQEGL
ncbi:hypothetical protein TVAG_116990 [Trichomonas vaginalis G3]|uniref:Suppressor of forked domain-containing protein n=1 Tax=Trichomonas vaginalis (strain ATCC PRA-98 / G3) TaxID=412133 RepID=A2E3N9_TRIV3|nr:mRNA 5'-splice site recognition [Trichomonas vaginalis G3]EAY12677.1 hypothetical protein TVAG_116990 [Trichomonas vaginalis G3]KAI5517561.1 mRNA 5'-splice site recognition [Trichomonas vaginalis G3]|eukprot:XP_001324900.1 hypothetical protein [Trichomonas vaginalis G3]